MVDTADSVLRHTTSICFEGSGACVGCVEVAGWGEEWRGIGFGAADWLC